MRIKLATCIFAITLSSAMAFAEDNAVSVKASSHLSNSQSDKAKSEAVKGVESSQQTYSGETTSFIVISEAPLSVNAVLPILRNIEEIAFELFGSVPSSQSKIVLQIVSENNKNFTESIYVDYARSNDIRLTVKWDENLKLDELCDAISKAVLRKLALANSVEGSNKIPYWLELAISKYLEQKSEVGVLGELVSYTRNKGIDKPDSVFDYKKNKCDKTRASISSYWTLMTLKTIAKNSDMLKRVMNSFLEGAKSTEILSLLESSSGKDRFEKLWLCISNYEIISRKGGVMQMNESAESILRMCFLSPDNEKEGYTDKGIFEHRQDDGVEGAIKVRIAEIKVLLPRINPAYFNTLVSLGQMYEGALDGDEEDFEKARIEFIESFKYAKAIEKKSKDLMPE